MSDEGMVRLEMSRQEFELIREALKLLLSTLGHEEAEELEEVRGLLSRLGTQAAGA